MTPVELNARDLERELAWFAQIIDARFKHYFSTTTPTSGSLAEVSHIAPPDLSDSPSPYASFLRHYKVDFIDRVALVLTLVPYVRPQLLDMFVAKNPNLDRRFVELGGVRLGAEGEFVPTGETLAFVLGGSNLLVRFRVEQRFSVDHVLRAHGILRFAAQGDELPMKAPLRLSEDCVSLFTTGETRRPDFGPGFPAKRIETNLDWDDIVLHPGVRQQLEDIETWLEHGDTLLHNWGMASKLRPGYRALFHGPPGVGKTITACLLGKSTERDVYKVDLSLVVSKYIGETEKNLARIFDQAQYKNWILFFDEADALFGKRSETKDAHDRFANQEVSYLLQRIESFAGVAILASNQRDNLDDAFSRRFESIVYFPLPRPDERLVIWRQGFSSQSKLDSDIDLEKIAHDHAMSGGSIMNIVRYASLQALKHGRNVISAEDLSQGIRLEYVKERKGGA
ncbi:MAG TPA: ATP-binding protein [Polyangium sp.]|nr:ATP-binding protein [Polyangium sp.]